MLHRVFICEVRRCAGATCYQHHEQCFIFTSDRHASSHRGNMSSNSKGYRKKTSK